MIEEIRNTKAELDKDILNIANSEQLEEFRLKYLVKKGLIQGFTERLREVPKEQKRDVGVELNNLKKLAEQTYTEYKEKFEADSSSKLDIDLTMPGQKDGIGTYHPIQQTIDEMVTIFKSLGFAVAVGPDIEDEYHNFDAANFAPEHPARDMQDTFYINSEEKILLRTHTTPMQVRVMKSQAPPIRTIMPGRVYRNEAVSARSLAEFHQIEGLYIDKNVTMSDLKGTMVEFVRRMYGANTDFRFRPSYFPFTEPSAEMDITCFLCGGKGCRVCKYQGWLEVVGCGMVHPNMLKECGIDPDVYSGFAFGFGIERVTMLKTRIDDIRLLYENDVRILKQFT
jgi:phenylalanyl-tRNA synthetase alpha chain